MKSKDTLMRYTVKQLGNAAIAWLVLAGICLMCARSAHAQNMAAIRAACTADAKKFCAGVQQGGGRVAACLKEHKGELSDRCKKAAGLPANSSSSSPSGDDSSSASSSDSDAEPSVPATPVKSAPSSKGAPAKSAPTSIPNKSAPSTSALANNTSYKGSEKFVERIITDTEHEQMRAATVHVPEKWTFESKIEWHYGWVEYPLSYSAHAENPDSSEAYFQYPMQRMDSIEVAPQLRQYNKGQTKPGDRLPTGAISMAPQPAMQALATFIKKTRGDVTNLKWLGQQDLPDLAKALKLAKWPNQHGVAIKISYDLNGKPVEEAFYGVYYIAKVGSDAVSYGHTRMAGGMLQQTNWGLQALQSFRAPAGTLDKRMPMFCVIAKSMYVNPKWARLTKQINDQMLADFNQKLKQGYAQLAAAEAIVDETMRQQAAFQKNFDKQEEAFRNSGGVDDSYLRDGGKRSAADHWDDLIRGVDTVEDPSNGGTTQLSNLGQYHFTDGFGNYRTTDDPNYTPEKAGEVGSWTAMSQAP